MPSLDSDPMRRRSTPPREVWAQYDSGFELCSELNSGLNSELCSELDRGIRNRFQSMPLRKTFVCCPIEKSVCRCKMLITDCAIGLSCIHRSDGLYRRVFVVDAAVTDVVAVVAVAVAADAVVAVAVAVAADLVAVRTTPTASVGGSGIFDVSSPVIPAMLQYESYQYV